MSPPIRVASFNAENFSLLLDRPLTREELEALDEEAYQAMNASIYNPNKERRKIAEVARTILAQDFDVVGLCEIGGMETLSAFNRLYLGGRYQAYLHEENSKRGIFVGALVKQDRFPWVRAANVPGAFARNLLKLSLGLDEGGLEIFVVHLKSQFGQDRGIEHRMKEIARLCTLVRPLRCLVMGDFNGIAIRGEAQFEYEPFLALPFRDVLEAVGIPADERRTHYHFAPEPHFTQLDYIFCSHDIAVLSAGVLEEEIPLNRAQRNCLPSDHLMIWAKLQVGEADAEGPPPRGGLWNRLRGLWGSFLGHRTPGAVRKKVDSPGSRD